MPQYGNSIPNIGQPRPSFSGPRPPFPGGQQQPPRQVLPFGIRPLQPAPLRPQQHPRNRFPGPPSGPRGFVPHNAINSPAAEDEITEDYDEAEDEETVSNQ